MGYFTVRVCPSCGSNHNVIVDKKYFVTKLLECQQCFLRFRHPPDTERFNFSFYQKRYQQNDSITTDIPSVAVLKEWIEFNFENSPKCAK
ncbi:MAG: hypothetical protein N2662_05370, partial [Bacteroidales bacterium]|nr:hypothetical protein [Bacteroidales bacterium]